MPEEIYITKEELAIYYSEQNMLLKDIAAKYSCTQACISSKVKKYGLERNYRNKAWLEQKHVVEKKKICEMASESFSSEDSIRRWMRHHGIDTDQDVRYSNMNRYSFDDTYFEEIDSEEKAYWLGFIVADGCLIVQKQSLTSKTGENYYSYRLQILLSKKDRSHIEKFVEAIKYTGPIEDANTILNGKIHPHSRVRISSKKLCEDLMKLNVIPRKSCKEKIPDKLKEDLKRHYIRGYFDGDGCFSFSKVKNKAYHVPNINFVGGFEILSSILDIIKKDVRSVNTVPHKAKTTQNHILDFGGAHLATEIMNWMYLDATIYLDRKYEQFQKWLIVGFQEDIVRPLMKVEESGRNDLAPSNEME